MPEITESSGSKLQRFLAVKILNRNKSCILVRKFENEAWTLPIVRISPKVIDPIYYMENVMQTVKGNYKVMAALNIFQFDWNINDDHHIYHVYEVQYSGKIVTELPEKARHHFSESAWKFPDQIRNLKLQTRLLSSFIQKGL